MKVLMICTGNTCRSPMAEGIFRELLKRHHVEGVQVASMGLAACDGDLPTAYAVEAMREIGIDISGKRAQRVILSDLDETDLFYVMTQSHKNILIDARPELEDLIKVLDIPDPYGQNLDVYRQCRDEMMRYFEAEIEEMEQA